MKIRESFVANSSSSSFIIGIKDLTIPEWCKKFLKPIFNKGTTFKTIEEYNKYILDVYCCDSIEEFFKDNEYGAKVYRKVKSAFEAGYTILRVTIDNNDETLADMIGALPKKFTDEICLIHDEG